MWGSNVYSISSAARALGVTTKVVRQLITDRQLASFMVGDCERILADVLRAYLKRRSTAAARWTAAPLEASAAGGQVAADALAYSVPGAAKAIGVPQHTIANLLRTGELRSFKLGDRTLIRAEELRALIERQLHCGMSPSPGN
jgi:excisionase family DNA binding protein